VRAPSQKDGCRFGREMTEFSNAYLKKPTAKPIFLTKKRRLVLHFVFEYGLIRACD
jgi:hypothetical protein